MLGKRHGYRSGITSIVISALLASGLTASGQDLVAVNDITGGASVFVMRSSPRSSRKPVITKSTRTKSQRLESAKKIRKQYDAIAISNPRRVRAAVVDPYKLPPNVKTMAPEKASILFAGVAEYYVDRDDRENSINFFREATELDPRNIKAKEGLSDAIAAKGNDYLQKDQAASARAFFQEALKFDPNNAAAYFGLGDAFSALDKEIEAVANYENALKADGALTEIFVPLGILYFQRGEIAKADEMLTRALARSGGTAETQLFLGMIRMSQNRNAEALAAFEKAKILDPSVSEASYQLGEVLTRLGRNNEAVPEYQNAVALKPAYFEAWLGLGDAQILRKEYANAVTSYRQAARLKNDNIDAQIALGDANRMAGNFNDAAGSYNLATTFISRRPDYNKDEAAVIYSKIGYVIGQQCQINMQKAIACQWPAAITALEKAVAIGGGNTADFANLGWAYYNGARSDGYDKREADKQTKLQLARANLEKAVAGNPSYVEGPLLNLGMVRTDLGDFAGAVDALTKVVNKEPKWVFALNELGLAYRQQKNYKDAITWFKKATEKDDKFAAAYFNLAEAEYKNGNTDNAKKAYEKLKKLGRNDYALQLELITNGAIRK